MTIHLVIGPPCGGKSTFVANNAPAGVPRFDFDRLADVVGGGEFHHERPPEIGQAVLAMRRGLMGWVMDDETEIPEIWIIHNSPSDMMIQRLYDLGAEIHVVDPGIDECLARAARDNRPDGTESRIRAWYSNPPEIPGNDNAKGNPRMEIKNFTAAIKAAPDDDGGGGSITAYASVFDTVDSYGDVVRKGAFADTLKAWEESGKSIPLLYGHNFADPFMNIGAVTSAAEDDRGLKITADLDLDNPTAAQVYRLIKAGRLSEMSFAFNYVDAAEATVDEQTVLEVRAVELFEVSVVPIGANRETEIVDVKSPAGRVLTAVKQANVDAETADAIVAALAAKSQSSTASDDAVANSKALARAAQARLLISERIQNEF